MSNSAKRYVEIPVGGHWYDVTETPDEVRERWARARIEDGLVELTDGEGVLLLHPDAIDAASQTPVKEVSDEEEPDLAGLEFLEFGSERPLPAECPEGSGSALPRIVMSRGD